MSTIGWDSKGNYVHWELCLQATVCAVSMSVSVSLSISVSVSVYIHTHMYMKKRVTGLRSLLVVRRASQQMKIVRTLF